MFIYSIYIDPTDYTVTLNDSGAKIVYEKDENGVIFRKRLDGTFTLNRSGNEPIFDKLMSLTFCETGLLTVTNDSGLVIQGSFHKKDLTISEDKCIISIKFDRTDEYDCLDKIADKEVNIIVSYANYAIPEVTMRLEYGKTYEYKSCFGSVSVVNTFNNVTGWNTLGNMSSPNMYDLMVCFPAGEMWRPFKDIYTLQGIYTPGGLNTFTIETVWVREINYVPRIGNSQATPPVGYTFQYTKTFYGYEYDIYAATASTSILQDPTSFTTAYDPYIFLAHHLVANTVVINDRCRRLNDVITLLLTDCIGTWESEFFKNPINPISGKDLTNLLLSQKSDAIEPTSSDRATRGILTFKKLMEYLRCMFNVYWAIDSNGVFRIEHKKYWDNNGSYIVGNSVGIDLTTFYPQSLYGTNQYTFESNLPIRETFKFMEAWNIDFHGTPISYENCLTRGDELKYEVAEITTDVDPELLTAYASKEGFAMYHCDSIINNAGEYPVFIETAQLTQFDIANAHLSWANLHYYYWKYDRFLPEGIMNDAITAFDVRALKYQKQIEFPYCITDFDPNTLITTGLGDGWVRNASFSFKTNWLSVELEYKDNI